jgi:HAD superfamily hydrolase (TIGR01549 family)
VDDPEVLHRLLNEADALLLDFDGPICSVFSGFPAPVVAQQLRDILEAGQHTDLPAEIEKAEDPFDVFRYAATLGAHEARYIEAALRAHEVEAVTTAEPTSGAHDLIHTWISAGRRLAIVSNNSTEAVSSYVYLHGLPAEIVVASRTSSDPKNLKPNPTLVYEAISSLAIAKEHCVFVGDSVSDMQASKEAGVTLLGFANKQQKIYDLAIYEPHAVVTNMNMLVDWSRSQFDI